MAQILTQQQQEDCLSSIVQVTLDNFSMAWRLLDLLIKITHRSHHQQQLSYCAARV